MFPSASTTKDHTYRVVVTPSDGTGDGPTGEASLTVSNTAPTLSGPTLSASTVAVGDTLTCTATATDDDPADTPTVTYAWSGGSTGATYTVAATDDPGDTLTCTATADDGDGGITSASASATVSNSAPTVDSVSVTPSAPQVGDTLTCAATASDADGGSPTLTYAWSGGSSGSTYVVASTDDPGDSLTCTATATDSDGGTDTDTASATVANTDPTVTSVSISPTTAYNDDTLTCTGTATDADGGTPAFTYAWDDTTSGASLGTGASLDLSTVTTASADVIQCTATATDADAGSAADTATLTLSNRAPTVSVGLTPATPSTTDTLTCAATVGDDDGDSLTTTFAWTVAGTTTAASTTSALSSTLSTTFTTGQAVVCTAESTDGKGGTTSDSDTVTITNGAPVVSGVSISPSTAQTDDLLTVSATTSDPDGDGLTVTYDWTVGGTSVLSGTSTTLDGATYFDKDEEVIVEVSAYDGTVTTTVASSSLYIDNTPPGAPSISISPSSPTAGDDLTCSVDTGSTDDDSDSITYVMTWEVDGLTYEAGGTSDTGGLDSGDPGWLGPSTTTWTDDTVDGDDVGLGETWTCTATPNDGDDDGTSADTSVTTEDATYSGTIVMPSTSTVDGYSHGEWSTLNGGGRVATRIVLTQACDNPILALYQHSSADTSINGSYYVMNSSGTMLDYTTYATYSGCRDCWMPHSSRLSASLSAGTTYYLGFQNSVSAGDMSGPSIYLDASSRTVGIATFDDPRADKPTTNIRGLSTTTVSWQNRWKVDCE